MTVDLIVSSHNSYRERDSILTNSTRLQFGYKLYQTTAVTIQKWSSYKYNLYCNLLIPAIDANPVSITSTLSQHNLLIIVIRTIFVSVISTVSQHKLPTVTTTTTITTRTSVVVMTTQE